MVHAARSLARLACVSLLALLLAPLSSVTAIDYIGGWEPSSSGAKTQCVNICVTSKPTPTCLDPTDPSCFAKHQSPGDFDYLTLEQLFMPQFCRDLLQGVDSTLSHQNVLPFPNGITCRPEVVKRELTIHGLWPNYNTGYPSCCNVSATITNKPYNAAAFAKTHPALLTEMAAKWVDPTQSTSYDTLCEIYNHEFQKHGLCFAAFDGDYARAAVNYFEATLNITAKLEAASTQINAWAKLSRPQTTVASIKALYGKNVQVLCSASDGMNQLGAIRSCFDKPSSTSVSSATFVQRHCAEPEASNAFVRCDAHSRVTLLGYTPLAELA